MFRTEFRFNGSIEELSEIIAADMINGLKELAGVKESGKKDVVERSRVVDEIDDYFSKLIDMMFDDIKNFDYVKAFSLAKYNSDLKERIKRIEGVK